MDSVGVWRWGGRGGARWEEKTTMSLFIIIYKMFELLVQQVVFLIWFFRFLFKFGHTKVSFSLNVAYYVFSLIFASTNVYIYYKGSNFILVGKHNDGILFYSLYNVKWWRNVIFHKKINKQFTFGAKWDADETSKRKLSDLRTP